MRISPMMAVLVFPFLLSLSVIAQSSKHNSNRGSDFCPDDAENDTLHDAPTPPAEIVRAVLATLEAKESVNDLGYEKAGKLLHAQQVQLATHEEDYIVLGDSLLSGADNYWFWLVRASPRGTKVYGWFGANCLRVTQRTHEVHRDLRADWASAAVIRTQFFRFHKGHYRLYRERYRKNN